LNKVYSFIKELHDAEVNLADDFHKVGERHAVEHDLWYGCRTMGRQAESRAEGLRVFADRYGEEIHEPHQSQLMGSMMSHVRRATADMIGRRPGSGLLVLADLRQLYVAAEEANFYWIGLGQVAQATRDEGLLETVEILHRQLVTQIKWLQTHLKETVAQLLVP
jgi:hypothetical protein